MNYWGSVKQLASHILNIAKASNKDSARILVRNLAASFETAELHTERPNEDLKAEAMVLHKLLLSDLTYNEYTLTRVNMTVGLIHKYLINKRMNTNSNKWKKYVKVQVSLGGGKLLQFISKMDKAYLNVSFDKQSNW